MEDFLRSRTHMLAQPVPQDGVSFYMLVMDKPENRGKAKAFMEKIDVPNPGFLSAIHWKTVDHEELMNKGHLDRKYATKRLQEKPRVVGIHLSHTAALLHFIEKGQSEWAMIFEEDVHLPEGPAKAKEGLREYIKQANNALSTETPQVHYIGHCFSGEAKGESVSPLITKATKDIRPRCRHAYVVNKAGARKLLDKSYPMVNNGDEMWANLDFIYISENGNLFTQEWLHNERKGLRGREKELAIAESAPAFNLFD